MSFIYGEELHPPYYNFMGPSTKIEDRISLNYKRKGQGPLGIKKGTLSFWIPSSKGDYTSLIHDLMYFSPDNTIRAYSDFEYLKNIESKLGFLGISAQYARRIGVSALKVGFSAKALKESVSDVFSSLVEIGKAIFTEVNREEQQNYVRNFARLITEIRRLNLPRDIQNELIELRDQQMLRGLPLETQFRFYVSEFFRTLPKLIGLGIISYYTILPEVKSLFEEYTTFVEKTDEYKSMMPYIKEIEEKLNLYLKEVGNFVDIKDLPLSSKLFSTGGTLDRPFVTKDIKDIDREKAKKLYIDYFKSFEKYANFMNERHKGNSEYEPFNLEPLNMERIGIVSAPSGLTTENLNDMLLFNQTVEETLQKYKFGGEWNVGSDDFPSQEIKKKSFGGEWNVGSDDFPIAPKVKDEL